MASDKASSSQPDKRKGGSNRLTKSPPSARGGQTKRMVRRGPKTAKPKAGKSGKSGKAAKSKAIKGQKTAVTKKRKRGARSEDSAAVLEPIPQVNVGFPIWLKFAIPTAIIMAALLVLEGFLVSGLSLKELDTQINKRGIDLVSSLASSAPKDFWDKSAPEGFEPGEEVPARISEQFNAELRRKLANKWNRDLKQFAETSKQDDGSQDIIAALLIDYDKAMGKGEVRAGSNERQGVSLSTSGTPSTERGVKIFKGMYGGRPVREFRKKIMQSGVQVEDMLKESEGDGAKFGWASIFLDAQAIQEVRSRTFRSILMITIVGAIAAVIFTLIIAAILTKPVRRLQSDMEIVASGDLDHRTVVASNDEIGALAQVFSVMTRNLATAQQKEANQKALERELSIATEIQQKLLPERIPEIPGLDIDRYYEAAKEVGGDYYDFLVIDQRHLGIVVADVSGKGIPGSMVMTMVRSLLRLASVRNFSPADTFKKVNRILAKDIKRGMFVTAIYMVFDIVDRKLKVASAGHNPLVVYRAATKSCQLVKPQGIALGFDKGPVFDTNIKEVEIELKPGDRLVAYTDGVNEAMDADEEEFGDDHFYELIRQHADLNSTDFVAKIMQAIRKHRGGAEQSDDITIATLAVR